jgi:hypothetical protein
MESHKKWTSFKNWNNQGPYLILITDCEWWDNNRTDIDDWFDRNCPVCKPDKLDTIIQFSSHGQYIAWQMTWG